jgi:MFS family permease
LLVIRVEGDRQPATPAGGILNNLLEGGRALWRDSQLRALIGYSVAVSVLVAGPMQVALPLLAKTRLAQGAAALGVLGTANGVGVLLGSMISGPLIRLTRGRLGLMLLAENALVGFAVAAMSGVHSLFGGTSMLVAIGLLEGTVQIGMLTWLQRRVPQALMGRTMSVLMLVSSALAPLSAAVAGSLIQELMLTGLLIGAGLSLSAIALFGLSRPVLRAIQLTAAAQPVAGE